MSNYYITKYLLENWIMQLSSGLRREEGEDEESRKRWRIKEKENPPRAHKRSDEEEAEEIGIRSLYGGEGASGGSSNFAWEVQSPHHARHITI